MIQRRLSNRMQAWLLAAACMVTFALPATAGSGQPSPGQLGFQEAVTAIAEEIHWVHDYVNAIIFAITAFVIAVLPVLPGFLRAAGTPGGQVPNPTLFDTLYTYAWFVTFGVSFGVYLVLMRSRAEARDLADADPAVPVERGLPAS